MLTISSTPLVFLSSKASQVVRYPFPHPIPTVEGFAGFSRKGDRNAGSRSCFDPSRPLETYYTSFSVGVSCRYGGFTLGMWLYTYGRVALLVLDR